MKNKKFIPAFIAWIFLVLILWGFAVWKTFYGESLIDTNNLSDKLSIDFNLPEKLNIFEVSARSFGLSEKVIPEWKKEVEINLSWNLDHKTVTKDTIKVFPEREYEIESKDNAIFLTFTKAIELNETLEIALSSDIKSSSWEYLNKDYSFVIVWVPKTKALNLIAPNNYENGYITAIFSNPMVPFTNLENKEADCYIEITPSVPWSCKWVNTYTQRFTPSEGYFYSQDFVAKTIIEWENTDVKFSTPTVSINSNGAWENWVKENYVEVKANTEIFLEDLKKSIEADLLLTGEKPNFKKLNIKDIKTDNNLVFRIYIKEDLKEYQNVRLNFNDLKAIKWNRINKNSSIKINLGWSLKSMIFWVPMYDEEWELDYTENKRHSNINLENTYSLPRNNVSISFRFESDIELVDLSFIQIIDTKWKPVKVNSRLSKVEEWDEEITHKNILILELEEDLLGEYIISIKPTPENWLYDEVNLKAWTLPDVEAQILKEYEEDYSDSFEDSLKPSHSKDVVDNFRMHFRLIDVEWYNSPEIYRENINIQNWHLNSVSKKYGWGSKWEYKISYVAKPISDIKFEISWKIKNDFYGRSIKPFVYNYKSDSETISTLNVFWSRNKNTIPSQYDIHMQFSSTFLDSYDIEVCTTNMYEYKKESGTKYDCEIKTIESKNLMWQPFQQTLNIDKLFDGKLKDKKIVRVEYKKINWEKLAYKDYDGGIIKPYNSYVYFFRTDWIITADCNDNSECIAFTADLDWNDISDKVSLYLGMEKLTYDDTVWGHKFNLKKWSNNYYAHLTAAWGDNGYAFLEFNTNEIDSTWGSISKSKVYIFPDRPIYKPGEIVHIKWIVRDFNWEFYEYPNWNKEVNYDFAISNQNTYEDVFSQRVSVNSKWEFRVDFTIPADAKLWKYVPRLEGYRMYNDDSNFYIEEYKLPKYKLTPEIDNKEVSHGDIVNTKINAEYYFGGKVQDLDGQYNLTSQSLFISPKWYEDYNFSNNRNRYYSCYYWGDCSYSDSHIKSDSLDFKNWVAEISFDTNELTWNKLYNINFSATDAQTNERISWSDSFALYNTDWFVWLKNWYYIDYKSEDNLEIVLIWTDEKPKAWTVTYKYHKIDWKNVKKAWIDGFYYNSYSKVKTLEHEWTAKVWNTWNTAVKYTPKEPWSYEVEIIYTWENGKTHSASNSLFVAWNLDSYYWWNSSEYEILADRFTVKPWETVWFTMNTPIKSWTAYVFTWRAGNLFGVKKMKVDSTSFVFNIPVEAKYIPSFWVKVVIIWKETEDSKLPAYAVWNKTITVDASSKELSIEIKTDKEKYLPWETVTWTAKVVWKDWKWVPKASWTLSVVNESLLALKWNPKKNIFSYFYWFKVWYASTTYATISNLVESVDIEEEFWAKGWDWNITKWWNAKKKRWEFRDTAFYKSNFVTDKNWEYKFEFVLPDNTTTWRTELVASTPDKFWVGYGDFMSTKEVIISDNLPNFIGLNDEMIIEPVFFNKSDFDSIFDISVVSDVLEVTPINRNIKIKANSSEKLAFKIKVKDRSATSAKITFKALAKDISAEDIIEKHLQIRDDNYRETVASWNYINSQNIVEEKVTFSPEITSWSLEIRYFSDILEKMASWVNISWIYVSDSLNHWATQNIVVYKRLQDTLEKPFSLDENYVNIWRGQYRWYEKISMREYLDLYQTQIKSYAHSNGWIKYHPQSKEASEYASQKALYIWAKMRDIWIQVDEDFYNKLNRFLVSRVNNRHDYVSVVAWDNSNYDVYKKYLAIDKRSVSYSTELEILNEVLKITSLSSKEVQILKSRVKEILDEKSKRIIFNPRWATLEYSIYNTLAFIRWSLALWWNDYEKIVWNALSWASFEMDKNWMDYYPIEKLEDLFIHLKQKSKDSSFKLNIFLNNNLIKEDYIEDWSINSWVVKVDFEELQNRNSIKFKKTNTWDLYYSLLAEYDLPAANVKPRDEWFTLDFNYYSLEEYNKINDLREEEFQKYYSWEIKFEEITHKWSVYDYLTPVTEIKNGEILIVKYNLSNIEHRGKFVFNWYIPSWSMLINTWLSTNKEFKNDSSINLWMFDEIEFKYDRLTWVSRNSRLYPWSRDFSYLIKITNAWVFNVEPSEVFELDNPEVFWRTGWYSILSR